jgi:type II secretion system protein H
MSATRRGPGSLAADARRGFTLLEILVVLVILAIAAGLAVATLDHDERGTLDRESRRFAGALEYAVLRAQLRHETLGVSAHADGRASHWRFWSRDADGRWRAVSDDDAMAPHALPAPLVIAPLAYAGRALPADAIVPLRASGRNEPYAFALAGDDFEAIVGADPLNRVVIDGPRGRAR